MVRLKSLVCLMFLVWPLISSANDSSDTEAEGIDSVSDLTDSHELNQQELTIDIGHQVYNLSNTDDTDEDGIINLLDKCPLDKGTYSGAGCPTDKKIEGVAEFPHKVLKNENLAEV